MRLDDFFVVVVFIVYIDYIGLVLLEVLVISYFSRFYREIGDCEIFFYIEKVRYLEKVILFWFYWFVF